MFQAAVTLIVVLSAMCTARADWQYTKWGMTPDQVVTASKGQMRPCNPQACNGQTTDGEVAQLFGLYQAGEFRFDAFAMFDKRSNKLSYMNLNLKQPERGASLIGSLRAKYGEPASHSRTAILEIYVWRDQKDQVSVLTIGSGPKASVSLSYRPRISDSNKGL